MHPHSSPAMTSTKALAWQTPVNSKLSYWLHRNPCEPYQRSIRQAIERPVLEKRCTPT
jgi:hypothetical protein